MAQNVISKEVQIWRNVEIWRHLLFGQKKSVSTKRMAQNVISKEVQIWRNVENLKMEIGNFQRFSEQQKSAKIPMLKIEKSGPY